MKPKVVFLLPTISQPRCIKRIRGFINAGFEIEIYGFDRGVYNVNSKIDGHVINILGFAESGKGYIKKYIYAQKALKKIFNKFLHENVIYYAFAFDIALICKMHSKKKNVYEISDLVYGYFNNKFLREIFTQVDRRLVKFSLLTIMTSAGFYKYLFPKMDQPNVIVQPNRVSNLLYKNERGARHINSDKIVFSFIGAFRYPNTVFRFAKIIGEHYPRHEFHFYGDSHLTEQVKVLSKNYSNVFYFGPFKSPEDLNGIYEKIDIVVACYDTITLNERIAEPNKLYESLFFKKPIIVSNNTFLSEQVKQLGCGFIIDASLNKNIFDFIESINTDSLNDILSNVNKLPLIDIIDDDGKKIIDFIANA